MTKRHRVMLTQALDVAQLEPRALRACDHVRNRDEFSIGENVLVNKCVAPPEYALEAVHSCRRPCPIEAHDSVIHEQPAGLQHSIHSLEVPRLQILTNVLHHSH